MRKLYDLPSLNSIGTVFNVNFLKVVLVTPLEVLGCGDPVGGPSGPDGDFSGVFDTLFAVFSTLCSFPVLPTVRFYFCMYLNSFYCHFI